MLRHIARSPRLRSVSRPPARFVAGHSLGEYHAGDRGMLSFTDAVSLVRLRGKLMDATDETAPGGMAAIIALDAATVDAVYAEVRGQTGGVLQVANYNAPGQVVISGDGLPDAGPPGPRPMAHANHAPAHQHRRPFAS